MDIGRYKSIMWTLLAGILVLPGKIFAQTVTNPGPQDPFADVDGLPNPIESATLMEFLGKLIDAVVTILIPVLVLALVYSGFLFVTARGNPDQLQRARRVFKWTIVGILIIIAREVIATIVENTVTEVRVD